jgi:predicted RNA methylase
MTDKQREQLIQNFSDRLIAGESFASITVARKAAQSILGIRIKAGDAAAKTVDEAMEAAVVRTATQLVQDSNDTHAAYDRLVDLMERQPRLGVKTTTSVLQQAYSTPIPIAFLAATLADIGSEDWVYEPTAGNGALLISANPAKVIANELNPDRAAELQNRGFASLNQADATAYLPTQQVDRVIMNPPFGSVDDGNGSKKIFQMFEISTQQIDRAIAAHGLRAMKDDGRAVLILGSNPGRDEAARSQRYHSRGSRGFFKQLYEQYNVTDHFTISGDLYRKQGAGFPIDIVVIEGRGKSRRKLPAADVPVIYNSFEQLKQEKLPNAPIRKLSEYVDTERGRSDSILRESPRTVSDLQPDTYLNFMEQRLQALIEAAVAESSQPEVQKLMVAKLESFDPARELPGLVSHNWSQNWADHLTHYNETFWDRPEIGVEAFPATPLTSGSKRFRMLLDIHEETTLEIWLNELRLV